MLDLNKIHLGDCRELAKQLPDRSVDAIITDPPYGVGKAKWDIWDEEIASWFVSECLRLLKPTGSVYFFGNPEKTACLWKTYAPLSPRWLTWFYRNSSNINHNTWGWNSNVIIYGNVGDPVFNLDAARIPYSTNTNTKRVNHDDTTSRYGINKNGKTTKKYNELGRKPMDVIEFPAVTAGVAKAEGVWHPTQKPLGLIRRLVCVCTNKDDLVLDFFSGGATTAAACLAEGRNFIGFESDQVHYESGQKRLQMLQKDIAKENGTLYSDP